MPIYEYKCRDCGHQYDYLHVSSEDDAPVCPECGSTASDRVMSTFSVGTLKSFGGGQTCCGASDPSQNSSCAGPGSCCSSGR